MRLFECGTGSERSQSVAARNNECLDPVELDGVSVVELDRDQRFDQHLVALSDEMGSQRRRIRFGACDEEAHQLDH